MFNQMPPYGYPFHNHQQPNPFHMNGGYNQNNGMAHDPLVKALQSGLIANSGHPALAAAFLFIMNVALHKRQQLMRSPEAFTLTCGVAFMGQAHVSPAFSESHVLYAADRIKTLFTDNSVDITTYQETSDAAVAIDVSTPGLTRI